VDEHSDRASSRAVEIARHSTVLRQRLGRGVSVGISGVDCAGKSTVAEALRARLVATRVPVVLVEGDEFTRPTAERYAEPDEALGYYRDSFDYGCVFEQILPAVRSSFAGQIGVRVTDWERDAWTERVVDLPPDAVVIVEGCFLFAGDGAGEFNLSVWLDLPLEEIVPRALGRPRDLERMGGPDGVRERYANRYVPGQRLHLERDRPQEHATLMLPSVEPADADLPFDPG
jgi:uridine kinase